MTNFRAWKHFLQLNRQDFAVSRNNYTLAKCVSLRPSKMMSLGRVSDLKKRNKLSYLFDREALSRVSQQVLHRRKSIQGRPDQRGSRATTAKTCPMRRTSS